MAGLGSLVACGCLLPVYALFVIAVLFTYGDTAAGLAAVIVLLGVIGLVAWLVRPRR